MDRLERMLSDKGFSQQIIFNKDCVPFMNENLPSGCVDVVLTSPPYNTNKKSGNGLVDQKSFPYVRYDMPMDNMTSGEYITWTMRVFEGFDRVLKKDGVVLYNLSYGNENTDQVFLLLAEIIKRTNFTIVDTICWKKKNAMPNNVSKNRLTRIWEFVFVLCRKKETKTFHTNKAVTSVRKNGQKMYESIENIVFAKNNDGVCHLNRATYSTDLCKQLLAIYAPAESVVFDPFCGTGTTANACKKMGLSFVGTEISQAQCQYAAERVGGALYAETIYRHESVS